MHLSSQVYLVLTSEPITLDLVDPEAWLQEVYSDLGHELCSTSY